MKIPERWLKYTPIGKQIPGTQFICFKVPLPLNLTQQNTIELENQLTPSRLLELEPNLGLIIDLTSTEYYDRDFFVEKGIEHRQIKIRGQRLATQRKHNDFANIVTEFLSTNNNTKLIGVHCTHGCNRTGLLLCTFLVQMCKFSPSQALEYFETARGHKIERTNYVDAINNLTSTVSNTKPNIASSNWRNHEVINPVISGIILFCN